MLGLLLSLAITTACGSPATAIGSPPNQDDIAQLENLRILEPRISPTKTPGRYFIEFAPIIQTRLLDCDGPNARGGFVCRFETRTKEALTDTFGPWQPREEVVKRDSVGRWRFER